MSDKDLRKKIIRLAHQKPHLRRELLPLLKTARRSPRRASVETPAEVTDFLAKIEASFRKYFKTGWFKTRVSKSSRGRGPLAPQIGDIYIQFSLLPKGQQSQGIIQNDPSYNTFWMFGSWNEDGLNPRIKIEISQGNRLYGPNASNSEKIGWRNGTGSPASILRKFDKYFSKLRSMVDARDDLPEIR